MNKIDFKLNINYVLTIMFLSFIKLILNGWMKYFTKTVSVLLKA